MYVFRFINIYMYVDNTIKSYIVKRREYVFLGARDYCFQQNTHVR